jgi:small subunit ribosomal protein S8
MDTIGNLITIIRNGYMAHRTEVTVPHSQQSESVCRLLVESGYLAGLEDAKQSSKKSEFRVLKLGLKYQNGQPILTNITRISKPGRRLYSSYKKLPRPLGGYGLVILTTNKGLMIDKDARKGRIGGEPLLSVW